MNTASTGNRDRKWLYRRTRDLHLYAGLLVSPFVLVFAGSIFFLNHATVDVRATTSVSTVSDLRIPAGLETARGRDAINSARPILEQVGVSGEIGFVRYARNERHLTIPVSRPGVESVIDVDVVRRTAVVKTRKTSVWESTASLHKMPGPHNADLRGNWIWTRVWRVVADGTVYLLLFVTTSGVYLWYAIKAERRGGWTLLAGGLMTLGVLLYALGR